MDTPQFKQLQEEYEGTTDERRRIDLQVDMAMEVRNYELERAMAIADSIIEQSKAAKYQLGVGRAKNLKGWCYWQSGLYDEGLDSLQEAYAIARDIKNRPLEARVLNNFGYIYRDRGDLATALNYFENALAINERLEDEVAQSVNVAAIAYIHYDLGDYENARLYALKCLPVFEAAKDAHRLTVLYHILGNIYFKQDQLDEAQRYFQENLNHSEPDTGIYVMALSGLGKVSYKMGHTALADEQLQDALAMAQHLNNAEVQISCLFYLGRMRMDDGSYRRALSCFEKGFELAAEYSRRHDVMSIHEVLSQLYDEMGNIPKAFEHLKAFEKIKEEIFQQATFDKLRNLQVRQQLELAQKEKEVAEQTAQLKQQFMANMSHEIRTPMNAIVGMTRLLVEKNPKPEQLRYLHAIRQSADNLLVIINDILDLSKIEAGKIIIEQTPFFLPELLQGVHDMLLLKAEEKGIELRANIAADVPQCLIGDPTRISQVLINLAGNAVKFTEKGYVAINIALVEEKESTATIRLDISDTGIGIAPDYVDKVFESFTQAGTDVARKFGGTGLGLTISRQLASLMHGDIFMHSDLGKGTTFSVVLPLTIDQSGETQQQETDDISHIAAQLEGLRILLAEDNEFNRMVAEDTLVDLIPGSTVTMAENGQIAVDLLRERQFDVVLMDIQMPVMDGVAATKLIRNELPSPAREIPIIAMTANVLQEDVLLYLKAGMDAYVAKPFEPEDLLNKMNGAINRMHAADAQ